MRFCLLISIWLLSFFTIADAFGQSPSLPAFPGAEGFGKYATGGRGGAVYIVTNLNDSGTGSLRWALEAIEPRTVVFEVSGNIELKSQINVRSGNLTVAGQTAPGDGITLKNYPLVIRNTSNIILRFIRSRMGDLNWVDGDALTVRRDSDGVSPDNIIIDHCSFSWGTDETLSIVNSKNITIQNCIISEGLHDSANAKGPHSYGGIISGQNISIYNNLISHFKERNLQFQKGSAFQRKESLIDFRNNVVFNWSHRSSDGGTESNVNLYQNYYKAGPASFETGRPDHIMNALMANSDPSTYGLLYLEGNKMGHSLVVEQDQWAGVRLSSSSLTKEYLHLLQNRDSKGNLAPHYISPGIYSHTHTADNAYVSVLEKAGASLSRDQVDQRIVQEVSTGKVTFKGSKTGLSGIIDSQKDVGGWPQLKSLPAPKDTDRDGMPDEWEIANGLDPKKADDKGYNLSKEYTNIEVYINSLIDQNSPIAPTSIIEVSGITTTPKTATLDKGKTLQIYPTISPSNASNKKVIWTSSNTKVATVNASGLVTAIELGSATITAITEDGGFTAKTEITVIENNNSFGVESFTLIDAGSNTAIAPLSNGDELNLEDIQNKSLNFRANINPIEVGSVYFSLKGPVNSSRTDNGYTYDLLNNAGLSLPAGNYTLTAIPYAERDRGGTQGTELTIAFSIIEQDYNPLNLSFGVETFTLIDAGSNTSISEMSDGDELDLANIRILSLNFRANTNPIEVGSVYLSLEGPINHSKTENVAPYALFGDRDGVYNGSLLTMGNYTLTAIPYSESNRGGSAGKALTIKFEVIDSEKVVVPTTPVLISPADGSKDLDTSIKLSWKNVENADTYRLQVSLTKDFSNRVLDSSSLKETYFQLGNLEEGKTYYWRVRATNTAGNSSYTATWSFSTKASVLAPSAPKLSSPESGTLVKPEQIVLEWIPVDAAEKYEVQVSTYSNFSQGIAYQNSNLTTHKVVVDLDPDKIYFWRVRAVNVAGTSPYSTVWSLITESLTPLDSSILLSPKNGAVIQETRIDLVWDGVDEASDYKLELSGDQSFSKIVASHTGLKVTYATIENLQPGTTYYWRVTASGSRPESQSEIWSFSVAEAEEEVEVPLEINVFPNPFREYINIEFSKQIEEDVFVLLFDNKGKTVLEKQIKNPGKDINLTMPQGMANGPYNLRIQSSKFVESRKVVKR
ncbi:Ig-like domain-containing protein [Aquiflexum sp.]|uniref:Ig-like domain-containing protein n=1 Tax=Aquiflexum sp. TaxID=1872584 RepID=UPI003593B21B